MMRDSSREAPEAHEVQESQEAHEALVQFLYQAPIGLVQAGLDGEIAMINPMAAQLLMPLAPQGDLSNLFDVLNATAPQLRAWADAAPYPGGEVCDGLHIPLGIAPPNGDVPATLSLRMLRLNARTLMCSVTDITTALRLERQHVAAEVRDAARIDGLTAMPNRTVVLERIEGALRRAQGDPGYRFVVLLVNGDRFNRVNVTLGQAAGDDLLRLMAARIKGALRQRHGPEGELESGQTAARLGVDEFVVVLEAVRSVDIARVADGVAQRLVDALSKPYTIGSVPVHSTASIGVVLGDGGAADAEAVLQDASLAMREAKRSGGARHCFFDPLLKQRAHERARLESELRVAIHDGQLFVVYQPITHLRNAGVAGVEALVRWQHPLRGLVSPLEFIGVAEETGLIAPLGAYVLNAACKQLATWQHQLGERAPHILSVNLSRAQLSEPTIVEEVRHALQASGVAPEHLQLEITESLAAENPQIQSRLHQLKALGVTLALDDFGTGYSSLSSLHLWPVDVIKIDRSFVSQVASSTHHRVLVEATVLVARSLGMSTVAEGVETAEQADALQELQCDKGQGYYYAKPLNAEAATCWLTERARPAGLPTRTPAASRAETTERLMQQLERSTIALGLFDPDERLVYANRSFRDIHWRGRDGTPTWEEIMRTAHARKEGVLIDTQDIERWVGDVRRHYRQHPRRVFESDLTDGRWMRVTEETAPDGWQLCVSSEVTSLKVSETELRSARDMALLAATTDPLTRLPNRRHVFACLDALMVEAFELRLPLTVAVIDLDMFKQINDAHGHGTGDSVLVAFAQRLGSGLRPRDVLGRIGGEEFLLLLMNTARSGAERVLGEARTALQAGALDPRIPTLKVNFSAGITVARPGDSGDDLWQRADRGLYAAKAAGRGCDVFVTPPEELGVVVQHRS
ncbi:MAG: EAL domain-containing protein [Pseudomonadota bacterium]|nr:EAL domain-containing protein [Pseudomonadota bacterium]